MNIRKSTDKDISSIKQIYETAREFMRVAGNPDQWGSGYPPESLILSDISEGQSYVVEDGGEIIATFYFSIGADPTYAEIYEGEWLNDEPYAVIHRVAVSTPGRGTAGHIFDYCRGIFGNIRIDTHRDNKPMQKTLEKHGFVRCGIIYLDSGDERIAYQSVV